MALAAVGLTLAGCGGSTPSSPSTVTVTHTVTTTRTVTSPPATTSTLDDCAGSGLSGTFAAVPGSAGAGQVEYALTLTNSSQHSCYVSGVPRVQLLGPGGSALPTHVVAAQTGTTTAARVPLTPGASAVANARFSPDVPGTGDAQSGPCQPKAQTLRVTPNGGGTVDAPVRPPTSVCERGLLTFRPLQAAG